MRSACGRPRRPGRSTFSPGRRGDQPPLRRCRLSRRATVGDRRRRLAHARVQWRLRQTPQGDSSAASVCRYSPGVTEYQTIKFEQSGPITRITLNRPDAANGMNDTMTRELADAATRCDTTATKAVVVAGEGRFFCAGGDLKSFAAADTRGPFIKDVADDRT